MRHDPLELAQENYSFQLRCALEAVEEGDATAEDLSTIAFSYRILGLCALLRDMDGERFARLLRKSGLARLHLLRQVASETQPPDQVLAISKDTGFVAALAAGDLDTATRIAERSPDTFLEGIEYEEEFLFFHFQQRLLRTPRDEASLWGTLDRWTRVVEGEPTVYLAVCQALLEANEAAFCSALGEVLKTRKESLRKYRKQLDFDRELDATEGKVYLNGLALVRLAQSRGVVVPQRLELIPRPAREASCPALPEDAWLSP
ncbi:Imm49 family immunity protein [Pyxidicoccus trucidator]|uniref:Imm49 family immunity protein n=1 Tax=Pyxidicoccus trucidator TaxID=2709662 RepID=UPI0013D9FDFA|nr:Imm49 family immunity protein [Pyxidicoccus trucidator]